MEIIQLIKLSEKDKRKITNDIVRQRKFDKRLVNIENDLLFEKRKELHKDTEFIKVGDW